MTNILALIYNKNLNVDETVVVSALATAKATQKSFLYNPANFYLWEKHGHKTVSFPTTKDLKDLEKELKEKDMAVYLHEKDDNLCTMCSNQSSSHNDKLSCAKIGCLMFIPRKKPLMLAVFGDEKLIKEMLK